MKDTFLLNASAHLMPQASRVSGPSFDEVRTELVRKSLHFLIALTPALAYMNRPLTVAILSLGTLAYSYFETLRLSGVVVPFVSSITATAARSRDSGRFVLGPVTLGIGALLSLLLYPSPAASIAIYALAFGDGFASLVGKAYGKIRPDFLFGKSLEGSAACFIAVFVAALAVSGNYRTAVFAALTATLVEALPLEDYDNILLPLSVGFVLQFMAL
jgi:dolichol kinase